MRLAISIIILATAASTFPIIDQKTNGTVIPLTKRSPSLKRDNSVDFDALHSNVESIDAKILRGLQNYERNMGTSHPLAMKGTELLDLKKRDVGIAALTRHNSLWYGTIIVGSPPKSCIVELDTGTSDIILPGPDCHDCPEDTVWDPASSHSAQDLHSPFEIEFEAGPSVEGHLYTDTVTIAGLDAHHQTIGSSVSMNEISLGPNGVVGMAFQSISEFPATPLFETLVEDGMVFQPVFSIKLTSNGGELYLGGMNDDLHIDDIVYTPVTVVGYWQVTIREIIGDGATILGDISAIIDTGADAIIGDQSEVHRLHETLGGHSVSRGYYCYLCNDFPTISFGFGGTRTIRIPASIHNLGPLQPGSPLCFSGIVARGNRAHWTLGGVFLRSVYTVFDFGNERVGFASLI